MSKGTLKKRWTRFRALVSFHLVATAQFLCPAAAADPASKIDPPAWSYRHSQEELQAYGISAKTEEPNEVEQQKMRQTRLRRALKK